MKVRILDAYELEERHSYWGFADYVAPFYTVLAIRCWKKRFQYLIDDSKCLHWWDADLFELTDPTTPNYWIEKRYPKYYKLKNTKFNFKIPIDYYVGPKCYLDNKDFMFDIIENPRTAYYTHKSMSSSWFATGDGGVS